MLSSTHAAARRTAVPHAPWTERLSPSPSFRCPRDCLALFHARNVRALLHGVVKPAT